MSHIDKLRKQIDKIDFQILDLLKKRSKIAENIGKEKKSNNLFRPERQASILKNIGYFASSRPSMVSTTHQVQPSSKSKLR